MIGLVVSRADSASINVGEALRSLVEWERHDDPSASDADGGGTYYRHGDFELREFEEWHLELDGVAEAFTAEPDFVAFLSRHAGETGPLLTAHFTGNFGPAEYGGTPGELSRACPNVQRAVVEAFDRYAPEGYEVGIECTHHGPSDVGAPSLFVELGSDESAWKDPEGARAVARAVLELSGTEPDADGTADSGAGSAGGPDAESTADSDASRHVVGFGGGHYAPQFERIVRETDWGVGHVAADWVLQSMGSPDANADVLERAFEQSAATRALVVGDRPELEAVLDDLGHRVVDETWLRVTTGVGVDLVAALEGALSPVDGGLRFGADAETVRERPAGDAFEIVSLPDDLLAEASGIDREATFEAVASRVLAFETVEGGTKPRGRAAVRVGDGDGDSNGAVDGGDSASDDVAGVPEGVVGDLIAVLGSKYDDVVREDDRVVATRETFDPAAAVAAGVPEGPAFGRLADGEAVEVGDETVAPEEVRAEETVSFRL
ncbi:D-aminoacyl-tRNA deacylase [Halobellus sp. GM3]|uniref:D-aminoacyl-tRNA deacylase n=1 Tax=Halobellus sp. GM3 TaxID=3458410 RepID=UPI00403D97E9